MAYSNNRIEAPVSIYDVQRAISNGSPDLGTLISTGAINIWARYKPVRTLRSIVGALTFATRKGVNFGVQVPFCQDAMMNEKVYNILNRVSGEETWAYLPPRGNVQGGVQEFYRLTDFARSPEELTPSEYGDPTPANLRGYNHMAKIPFISFVGLDGATEKSDIDGTYYEVNTQLTSKIVVTFMNSSGDDLHLQDFINVAAPDSLGRAWRPVLQVFNGYIHLNSQNLDDRLPWYERSNLGSYDTEVCGAPITNVSTDVWTVELNLSSLSNQNDFFHMCIGVGFVSQDFFSWGDSNPLFILPYTPEQDENSDYPFYFRFKLVSHIARRIEFVGLQYYNSSNVWVNVGGTAPYFEVPKALMQGTTVGLTFTITKQPTQAIDFVGENGTSTYPTLKMQARESLNYGTEVIKYLTPANPNNNWSTVSNIFVAEGPVTDTVNLYAWVYIDKANASVGDTLVYHIYARVEGDQWNEISFFSIKMI